MLQSSQLNLKTWKNGTKRAPHKPLLLLFALGRWKKGQKEFPWLEVKEEVKDLIAQFGGSAGLNPHYPFVRLRNDGIWQLSDLSPDFKGDLKVSDLNLLNNRGSFSVDFEKKISNKNTFEQLIESLLDDHFSETMHDDIRLATGLNDAGETLYKRKQRDPYFRQSVLDAYQHKCAICGYNLRYRNTLIGVEAAHIQWHNSQGPDAVNNGLALCSIHHKLLDYGAIGFNDNLELLIATGVNGQDLDFWLHRHQGKAIDLPSNGVSEPRPEYLKWQLSEVFKG
jgi:putative restriction endonuclease